ncbi:MAG: hypothetical protein Q8P32_04795 [Candidatus Komeilibacteria bacterium]|nr:hypothetical protein [Candidatus Komeilibacteria bacterium]
MKKLDQSGRALPATLSLIEWLKKQSGRIEKTRRFQITSVNGLFNGQNANTWHFEHPQVNNGMRKTGLLNIKVYSPDGREFQLVQTILCETVAVSKEQLKATALRLIVECQKRFPNQRLNSPYSNDELEKTKTSLDLPNGSTTQKVDLLLLALAAESNQPTPANNQEELLSTLPEKLQLIYRQLWAKGFRGNDGRFCFKGGIFELLRYNKMPVQKLEAAGFIQMIQQGLWWLKIELGQTKADDKAVRRQINGRCVDLQLSVNQTKLYRQLVKDTIVHKGELRLYGDLCKTPGRGHRVLDQLIKLGLLERIMVGAYRLIPVKSEINLIYRILSGTAIKTIAIAPYPEETSNETGADDV